MKKLLLLILFCVIALPLTVKTYGRIKITFTDGQVIEYNSYGFTRFEKHDGILPVFPVRLWV